MVTHVARKSSGSAMVFFSSHPGSQGGLVGKLPRLVWKIGWNLPGKFVLERFLLWPMANLLNFSGIPYLVGKIKFKLLFQGPLAK